MTPRPRCAGIYDRPPGQSVPMGDTATLAHCQVHDGSTISVRRRRRRLPGACTTCGQTHTSEESKYKRDMHWSNAYGAHWPERTASQMREPDGKWSECARCSEGHKAEDFIFSQKWGLGDFTGREMGGLRAQRIRKGKEADWDAAPSAEEGEEAAPSSVVAPLPSLQSAQAPGVVAPEGSVVQDGGGRVGGPTSERGAGVPHEEETDCLRAWCPSSVGLYLSHQWYLIGLGWQATFGSPEKVPHRSPASPVARAVVVVERSPPCLTSTIHASVVRPRLVSTRSPSSLTIPSPLPPRRSSMPSTRV